MTARGKPDSGEPARILVVDDGDKEAQTVADVLESRLDATVVVETDPTAVSDHLDGEAIDCIVSDYEMPEIDGLSLLSAVREEHPDLPFVLLTGAGSETVASQAISEGASEYVQKGTSQTFDDLVNRVRALTRRYRTERRLRQVHERRHRWMDAATDGFFEYDVEDDTLVLREGFEETFDIPQGEYDDGLDWFANRIHPDDHDRVVGEISRAIGGHDDVIEQAFRLRDGNGEFRHVRQRAQVVSEGGDYAGTVGAVWDVTENVVQEERLEAYEILLNNTDDVALLVGTDCTVQQANDGLCELTGQSREELIGTPVGSLIEAELADPEPLGRAIESVLDEEYDAREVEVRLDRASEGRTVADVRVDPVTTQDGTRGVAITARDVTERVDRELTLEEFTTATQDLVLASSRDEIASIAMEAVEDVFDCDLSSVWYAEDGERLRMREQTTELHEMLEQAGDPPFVHDRASPVWDVYETGEVTVLDDIEPTLLAADVPVTSAILAPLGEHGLLSMAGRKGETFTGQELDLTRVLARTVTTTLDRLEREDELARNRDMLAESQRLAQVGAWEYDPHTDTVVWTDEVRRIHGTGMDYSPTVEEAMAFFHPDDRPRVRETLERAREYGIGFDQRVRIVREDGEVRWVRNVGRPQVEDGTVVQIRGAIQDITDLYEQRRQLQANEEALRELHRITTSPDKSTDERIDALLEAGRDRLGLSVAFLTDIDEDTVEVTRVLGDTDEIRAGQTLPLEETFCRRVSRPDDVETIYDVQVEGLAGGSAHQRTGLSSYLGAGLLVEQEFRGTVCFGDPQPRTEPFSEVEQAFVRVIAQQVSSLLSRQQRRNRLTTLYRTTQSLWETTSVDAMPSRMVEEVDDLPASPPLVFYQWDESGGTLERTAVSESAGRFTSTLPDRVDGPDHPIWEAFVHSETQVSGPQQEDTDQWAGPDCTGIAVPVAELGVIVACRAGGFQAVSFEVEFLETLGRNMAAALEAVEQTHTLEEYTDRLETQNEQLERLGRLNSIIRDTQRTLVEARTRNEIEQAVCDSLAQVEHWTAAWIGTPALDGPGFEVNAATDDRVAALAAPDSATADEPLAARTARTGTPTAVPRILSVDGPEPWRQTALEFGYQSVFSVPIAHEERDYGVLEIYADRPGAFTDDEQDVLSELATTIAYAIGGAERRQALRSAGGVELDLRVPSGGEFLLDVADILSQEVTITGVVSRTGDGYLAYATVEDADAAVDALESIPVVERVSVFGSEESQRIEIGFSDSHLLRAMATLDARVERLVVGGETTRVRVVVPETNRVRAVFERFRESYPETTVVAQRSREPDAKERPRDPLASLTERQREVLTIAYHRGLFEWPRHSDGEEVAEALGIAPTTLYQHVRAAQRQLMSSLLDE